MTERGTNRSWMRRTFPDFVEIKGVMKMIVLCKPTRLLTWYTSDLTFGTDSRETRDA